MASLSEPPADPAPTPRRRGRPTPGTEVERRDLVLDAALEALIEMGADQVTMSAVARQAGASKETLYRWFGDRQGLFAALIQRNADRSAIRIEEQLGREIKADEVAPTLVGYATGLLSLLTGPSSVALNRAAMVDPDLRTLLLEQGRHRIGPLVEDYLARAEQTGAISTTALGGPAGAFELLYGLVVRDTQIRVLLGEAPLPPHVVKQRASEAVDQFLTLSQVWRGPRSGLHPASTG